MNKLADDKDLKHNVDWLTEVIRRYSDALSANRSLSSVNMKSSIRPEKVCIQCTKAFAMCDIGLVEEIRDTICR
jgi:hypothetical protein